VISDNGDKSTTVEGSDYRKSRDTSTAIWRSDNERNTGTTVGIAVLKETSECMRGK
jgi:hypothetical protein